ncbi:hypothetical protein IX83_02160 [Basilea psittacipulmonis DSM 24701]|uniref:Thiamine-phosphate synthase n=2 Tax=Basilea TaxID=1472344 RepID=A0A077DDS9_9BURK|nr:hypothetical protein IX83_02160 [Basilea psittacipulmonis DSM 24701]
MSYDKNQKLKPGLYAITPDNVSIKEVYRMVNLACQAGLPVLQWRRKDTRFEDALNQIPKIQDICDKYGTQLIINDDWQLAIEVGADGVHLGKDDGDVVEISNILRQKAPKDFMIGMSCYNDLSLLNIALEAKVDYIAFGALFPSRTKPQAVHANLDLFSQARRFYETHNVPCPSLVGIGGIDVNNAASVVKAGADNIAVISALFHTKQISARTKEFQQIFKELTHDN